MTLKIYNTLTRCQEEFKPSASDNLVKMYYCGVTVYDYCHLGHARACIVWDVVRRYLQFLGYKVRYVQNFTDIDDKILNRARVENSSMEEVAERYIRAYFEDMARLNIKEADEYPRATHTIDGIKRLIHELEQKDYAYASGGDVYYKVRSFAEYGKLSGRKLQDSQAGASGIEDAEASKKHDPLDFALWKAANAGEPYWKSPWGAGRPGWHIECSAMVRDRLGDTIDIHAGGADLIFPHHENEIAQSEAVTGKPLANYWLHNGMVTVDDEKMSKSLGNFITIRELLDRPTEPMAVRLFVLMAHYRKPIDFSDRALESAKNGWETLKDGLLFGDRYGKLLGWSSTGNEIIPEVVERFQAAVNEDFNFSSGLSVLFELAKDVKRERNILVHQIFPTFTPHPQLQAMWHTLVKLADVLGLEAHLEAKRIEGLSDEEIEELLVQRAIARQAKDFAKSDQIRNQLLEQGITVIDSADGSKWHRN